METLTSTMRVTPSYEPRKIAVTSEEMREFAILAAPLERGKTELRIYRNRDGKLAFRQVRTGNEIVPCAGT